MSKLNQDVVPHAVTAPVLIQRDPVIDPGMRVPMCRLTMYSQKRSLNDCLAELQAAVETLEKIDRTFLVRFVGAPTFDVRQRLDLPENIAILEDDACEEGMLLYKGQRIDAGWEYLGEWRVSGILCKRVFS